MTIKEIVEKYLFDNGFDGLTNCDGCGCLLYDLMPCDGSCEQCQPGYIVDCDHACGENITCISPEKGRKECFPDES